MFLDPALFLTLSEMLVNMLRTAGSLSLSSSRDESPLLVHTVNAVVDFAKTMTATGSTGKNLRLIFIDKIILSTHQ